MNERILQLAKQAGLDDDMFPLDEWDNPELEKFAELIIQECASICELNGQSYTHSFTPAKARLAESTSNHCAMMIKKHFGVKE